MRDPGFRLGDCSKAIGSTRAKKLSASPARCVGLEVDMGGTVKIASGITEPNNPGAGWKTVGPR